MASFRYKAGPCPSRASQASPQGVRDQRLLVLALGQADACSSRASQARPLEPGTRNQEPETPSLAPPALRKSGLPEQVIQNTTEWPFVRYCDPTATNRIVPHVLPFLVIIFTSSQLRIPTISLEYRRLLRFASQARPQGGRDERPLVLALGQADACPSRASQISSRRSSPRRTRDRGFPIPYPFGHIFGLQ